ncbi:MFS transporter [Nocardia beijingensis]|uniref:MFS transporter n=1 Tax=Nocardia beijingensis TaxID=95162 RepID=UPI003F4CD5E0
MESAAKRTSGECRSATGRDTSWGILFYAFPVLLGHITTDTGWPATVLTAAFSAGQLLAALTGIPVGRWLDRHGPCGIMTTGSLLSVPALILVATAPTLVWFVVGWLLAGVAMGAVLYDTCPTVLDATPGWNEQRKRTQLRRSRRDR